MIRPDDEELTIETGGKILGGWTRLSVTRGVEMLPSHFECELTENAPGQASKAVVTPGAACVVKLGNDKVLTGWIDRYMPHYDKDSHRVRIVGRSKTEDIVDCSIDTRDLKSWEITAATIGAAARILCKPYNIEVIVIGEDPPLPTYPIVFSIYPGYTAYQMIEEMARVVGMLVFDDADGNLVLARGGTAGRAATALVEGKNIETGDATHTLDQRFSDYLVAAGLRSAHDFHIPVKGEEKDPDWPAGRGRRFKMIPADGVPEEFMKKRAIWEANRRYGRSLQTFIHVTGWRDGADKLWTPNSMVHVDAPNLKTANDRCIAEVSWMRDEQGTYTRLVLEPVKGLIPEPIFPVDRLS